MTAQIDMSRLGPPAGQGLVVTGGCGGIGSRLVRAALDTGLKVAVLDLPRSIAENPPPAGVPVHDCDATDETQVADAMAAAVEELGEIQHLVNLAGFAAGLAPVEDLDPADFAAVMDGSVLSTMLCSRAAIPAIRAAGGGSIVNMSSDLGAIGRAGYAGYAAAKAAVAMLTRTLAAELAPAIRVNCVSPSAVDTPFLSGGTGRGGAQGAASARTNLDAFVKTVPMGRVAVADDVVAPILFLMGDAARYMTAQVLHINGGWLQAVAGRINQPQDEE